MSDDRDEDLPDEHAEPDARERAEAEALAAALEGQPHGQEPPEDAFATALLVRHGGPRGELSRDRSEQILNELLGSAPAANEPAARTPAAVPAARSGSGSRAKPAGSGKVVRLLPWAAALTAAAASLLLMLRGPSAYPASEQARAPAPPASPAQAPAGAGNAQRASAPPVSVGLLSAQSAWLRAGLERERSGASAQSQDEREAAARFEHELRAYRADLFRALHGAYPGKLGQRGPAERPQTDEAQHALAARDRGTR